MIEGARYSARQLLFTEKVVKVVFTLFEQNFEAIAF